MTEDAKTEIVEVITQMVAAMNRHDLAECLDFYSSDPELQDGLFPIPVHGLDKVREGFMYWFQAFPDVRVRVVRQICDPPDVAVEWAFEATHSAEYLGVPATGKQLKVLTAAHFRVEHGKVTRDFSLFDASGLRQLQQFAAET
jgi:steroid delta-isomerase-like uncharacterized protein